MIQTSFKTLLASTALIAVCGMMAVPGWATQDDLKDQSEECPQLVSVASQPALETPELTEKEEETGTKGGYFSGLIHFFWGGVKQEEETVQVQEIAPEDEDSLTQSTLLAVKETINNKIQFDHPEDWKFLGNRTLKGGKILSLYSEAYYLITGNNKTKIVTGSTLQKSLDEYLTKVDCLAIMDPTQVLYENNTSKILQSPINLTILFANGKTISLPGNEIFKYVSKNYSTIK